MIIIFLKSVNEMNELAVDGLFSHSMHFTVPLSTTVLLWFLLLGIFLHHTVAWPSGNLHTINHEDRPRRSPLRANLPNRRVALRLL